MDIMIFLYFGMLLFNFYIMFVLYRKNYDRSLSAWCIFFLFIPIIAPQSFGTSHNVVPGGIISFFAAMIYWALKTDCKPVKQGKAIGYILLLSILISVFGTFDFSVFALRKISETRFEMQKIRNGFFAYMAREQNDKKHTLSFVKSNISSYVKSNINRKDSWGNPYKIPYNLKVDDGFIIIDYKIKSAGPDCIWNTADDITYSWDVEIRASQVSSGDSD